MRVYELHGKMYELMRKFHTPCILLLFFGELDQEAWTRPNVYEGIGTC